MKNVWRYYGNTLILLGAIILGGIAGLVFGEKTSVVQPLGDLFLNLLFMIITPLVFFSISSAIANMKELNRFGHIMKSIVLVFLVTSLVAAILGFIGFAIFPPVHATDIDAVKSLMASGAEEVKTLTIGQQLVNTFSVSDFVLLLSKQNMLPFILFSTLFGLATALSEEKGKPMADFLASGAEVTIKFFSIIMLYAPIGIGCYFATVVGQLGTQIVEGYFRGFMVYLAVSLIYYAGFYSLYAFMAGGKKAVGLFWKNIISPSVTSISTCSSAACIPINITAVEKMGVSKDIGETIVPFGANVHKDGSVIGGVFKIVFLFGLFSKGYTDPMTVLSIIGVSFLVGTTMAAVPGGGMIAELLILTIFGFPVESLPIVAVITTIIDIPATLLNVTGNCACAMLVNRMVEGKNCFKKSESNISVNV